VNELIFNKVSLIPTFAEPAQGFPQTIRLLQQKLVDPELIISHTFGFNDAEEMFRKNESAEHPVLKPVFVP
jgi:threonine dehydrogenase-like Zn-dependent dehydrogenase